MKTSNRNDTSGLVAAAVVVALLSGCASTPKAPAGSEQVRSKLMLLKSESALAATVPVAIGDAEAAVKLAEMPESDRELSTHRIYMADHMIDTTRATAQVRLAESQRAALSQQRDANRLAARTQEANQARDDAASARADAGAARAATAAASLAADMERQQLAEQIALLEARNTDRGIVLTLGDVLFATGSANLKPGSVGNLDRLVTFLEKYPQRTAMIEGHTDSMGSDLYNQDLSLRRANSVRGYLAGKGISSTRLTSVGRGEVEPVATNESAGGRQQNRRVEIVIGNETSAPRASR